MDSSAIHQEEPAIYGPPVPEEVLQMVREAVQNFHECFWWWDTSATIANREDVRAVVECLRESGGHHAWWTAQRIHKLTMTNPSAESEIQQGVHLVPQKVGR